MKSWKNKKRMFKKKKMVGVLPTDKMTPIPLKNSVPKGAMMSQVPSGGFTSQASSLPPPSTGSSLPMGYTPSEPATSWKKNVGAVSKFRKFTKSKKGKSY